MSVNYTGVGWTASKRAYDLVLLAGVAVALAGFVAVTAATQPAVTVETLLIRATALTAFALLHVVLAIGPLARLDRRFLPLLYNRRHLGVAMFLLALAHAVLSIVQFHAFAPGVHPLVSVFTAYRIDYLPARPSDFPFEPLGALALTILFLMAATSHDFWLRNLGPAVWKSLHLGVLVAYGAVAGHVAFGVLQSERSPALAIAVGAGVAVVLGLHVAAAVRERRLDRDSGPTLLDDHERACDADVLVEGRGQVVRVGGRRVAVYLHEGRVYALSNVCRHQGGPLGEGRILDDGCITCPWHGWQYRPVDGASPPPFEERVPTYPVRIVDGAVWIRTEPDAPGTPQSGAELPRGRGGSG